MRQSKKLRQAKRLKSECRIKPHTKGGIAWYLDTVCGTSYVRDLDFITLTELKHELSLYWV